MLPVLATVASVALAALAEKRYRSLPIVPAVHRSAPLPSLSVIVPARNEADNLPRLLRSLATAAYPGEMEIIVVDDGSTDGTGGIAEAYGATVLRLDHLPDGWLGKPHACHRGAAVARGEWLLFTDADTVHAAASLGRVVAWARQQDLDGLSLFPGQETGAFADRPVLAVAFAGYFAGLPRTAVVLNGQFVLLRRRVYEASGGFAAVRHQPLEDLALGHRLRALGYHVPVARGEGLVRVRMYSGVRQMWHGFTRIAALSLRWSGAGALVTALFTASTAAPAGALVQALVARRGRRRAAALWLITCAGLLPWMARVQAGPWTAAAPLAASFVQAAAIWGLLTRALGLGIRWKGRSL